jgi:hypothetical protein
MRTGIYVEHIYKVIMQRVSRYFPVLKILTLEDYEITTYERKGLFNDFPNIHSSWNNITPNQRCVNSGIESPKAILIGDSYSEILFSFMRESISEITFLHLRYIEYLPEIIDKANPDIIFIVYVERMSELAETNINLLASRVSEKETSEIVLPISIKDSKNQPFHFLDWVNGYEISNSKDIAIKDSSDSIMIEGWALDGLNNSVASRIIIEVGNEYIEADYSKERGSVSDYFEKQHYKYSGYSAYLNTQKVLEAGGFSVHVISADGTYQYEPQFFSVSKMVVDLF